jgi:GH15 family glucan-1,4-alpha-glucosidase
MTLLIEDYAIVGNNATAALVGRNGSIDWLCFPRFDSAACFAALLGSPDNGHWSIAPKATHPKVTRRYREGTLVLETEFSVPEGTVVLIDCMDRRGGHQDVIRIVRGIRGRVPMQMEFALRFDYGTVVPWVSRLEDNRICAVAGPDRIVFSTTVELRGEDLKTRADFEVEQGQTISFAMTWTHSFGSLPSPPDPVAVVERVTEDWKRWSSKYVCKDPYGEAILRSIITLKALTHHETGGIVAAATTSLPEQIGGIRNWDYRFCWIRDATYTLYALMGCGFMEEAKAWRDWLLRAVAGKPDRLQIMYGIAGERRLTEFELAELPGYAASRPVRIGNAASGQLQLDVYGELLDSAYLARHKGLKNSEAGWELGRALVSYLEKIWTDPDEGIWEIRGPRRHFVHSKVMAWVAFDRAVRIVQEFGQDGPLDRWVKLRSDIHDEVCRLGFSRELNSFVQYYGGKELDASLLLLPLVGFLPPEDPRIIGTVTAIETRLMQDGLVARYNTESSVDGLTGNEGTFLACSFWMVDNYVLQGRIDEARSLFEHLLSLRNDVGLLAEEYDAKEHRQLGNFPQAFSHLALVNSAHNLSASTETRPAHDRSQTDSVAGKTRRKRL